MASFSETRAAARRVAETTRSLGAQRRAHSESMAQSLRASQARQNATKADAYGKAAQLAANTADFQRRAAMGEAQAQSEAGQKLSMLMNNLTGTFVTNARKVMQAEQMAEVASLKEEIRKEENAGFIAGISDNVNPNGSIAYRDAAKKGTGARLAQSALLELDERLMALEPGANSQDEVYRYVDQATEGMDPQTAEVFTKQVLEDALPRVAAQARTALDTEQKEETRKQENAGFVAGLTNDVDPDGSIAYLDAAKEGTAARLAQSALIELDERLMALEPGANGQDEVYRYVAEATEGMDQQTAEFFTKRVLEGAMPKVAIKAANDSNAARLQVENEARAALFGDFKAGNLKTGEDFTAAVDRYLTVRKGVNPGQARAGLFSDLRDYAAKIGKSSQVLRLMDETGMTDRHPAVAAEIAANAQKELAASHKATANQTAQDVELTLAQIGNTSLYNPDHETILYGALAQISIAQKSHGRHDSLSSASTKARSLLTQVSKARAEYDEWTRWVESGGTAAIDDKVRDLYESEQYKGLLLAVEQAAKAGDQEALDMLTQRHKAHMARVGYIPRKIAAGIMGVLNVDLDHSYKDKDQREAFLVGAEAKLRLLYEADAASGDGRLLQSAVGDDNVTLAKMNYLKSVFESGGSLRDSIMALSRNTQPGQFRDAVKAMDDGGFKAHLTAVEKTGPEIVADALNGPGWFDEIEGNPALNNRVLGAYRTHLTIFGGPGVDPEEAHEAALEHARAYAQGITATLPTADGERAVMIPNRAVRDQLRTPINGRQPAELIAENLGDAKAALTSAVSALKADGGWFDDDDLPAFLEVDDFYVDPNTIGPDGSMGVVGENGITPVILSAEEVSRYETDDEGGAVVPGADNLEALLKPFNLQMVPDGYGQFRLRYRYDQGNLDAAASEKIRKTLAEKEQSYIENAGPRRPFTGRITGPTPAAPVQEPEDDAIITEEPPLARRNETVSGLVSTVQSIWDGAGTNINRAATAAHNALNRTIRSVTETLRSEGLVASSLGGTREPAEVTTIEEGLSLIQSEIDDHQVKRHAGIPVDPKSGKVEGSYAYRRREALIESEGDYGTKVYGDHKGIPTVGVGVNLRASHNAAFIEKNFGHPAEDYISGKRRFTQDQVDILFDHNVTAAEQVVNRKLPGVALTANQRVALVSLAFNNPDLIGPNLIGFVKSGDWKSAELEIRQFSNRNKHKGIQNRRNREADLFAMDTHDPDTPFYSTS